MKDSSPNPTSSISLSFVPKPNSQSMQNNSKTLDITIRKDFDQLRSLISQLPQSISSFLWLGHFCAQSTVLEEIRSILPASELPRSAFDEGIHSKRSVARPEVAENLLKQISRCVRKLDSLDEVSSDDESTAMWNALEIVEIVRYLTISGDPISMSIILELNGKRAKIQNIKGVELQNTRCISAAALDHGIVLPMVRNAKSIWEQKLVAAMDTARCSTLTDLASPAGAIINEIVSFLLSNENSNSKDPLNKGLVHCLRDECGVVVQYEVSTAALIDRILAKLKCEGVDRHQIVRAAYALGAVEKPAMSAVDKTHRRILQFDASQIRKTRGAN